MKIRIKGNSIRYRLTKGDVHDFSQNGYIEEITNFGNDILLYALQRSFDDHLSATFINNKITLLMPDAMIREWAFTDKVGFNHTDNGLFLLIEKDFQCLDNVVEDQSDNYPNPLNYC